MKLFSPRAPLKPAKARNCVLINLFATPGLGSLMAGRVIAGLGQLILALAGFVMIVAWFVETMLQFYGQIDDFGTSREPKSYIWLVAIGAATFGTDRVMVRWSRASACCGRRKPKRQPDMSASRPGIAGPQPQIPAHGLSPLSREQ